MALISSLYGFKEAYEVGMGSVLASPSITLLLATPLVLMVGMKKVPKGVIRNYVSFTALFPLATLIGLSSLSMWAKQLLSLLFLTAFITLARYLVKERGEMMVAKGDAHLEKALRMEGPAP